MNDSFEKNEQLAREFPGIRQNTSAMFNKRGAEFQVDLDEKPTRDRPLNQVSFGSAAFKQGETGQFGGGRQQINIDENDDTFHNVNEFKKIMERGQRLKERMNEAIGEDAWTKLHGPHEIPKKYVPPFLREDDSKKRKEQDASAEQARMDNIYEMEIEAALAKNMSKDGDKDKKGSKVNRHMVHDEDCLSNSEQEQGTPFGGKGGNIMDMKFIRFKIKRMSIDDDDLCQQLIENGFSLTGALPLPDVYTKNIKDQFIKLSNYDVVSVNEFEFTSLTLYNFKVSEETITELSNSQIQVMLDDLNVHG